MEFFSFYFTLFLTPLFLFSDIFFPIAERFSGAWLLVAEVVAAACIRCGSRASRSTARAAATRARRSLLWDCGYILVLSAGLLLYARRWIRRRLTA